MPPSTARPARCPRCGQPSDQRSAPGYCALHDAVWRQDRQAAVAWAHWALTARNVVILDTETTGLDETAEVLEIALLSTRGEVLLDTRVKPASPIPAAATAVHGLDAAAVADAPSFRAVYPQLAALLRKRFVVVYNAAYDRRLLEQTSGRYGLTAPRPAGWHCAMLEYARFSGMWNRFRDGYTWHKLEGGDHSALGDCRATRATLEWMAEDG